jgi:Uncharacterized membrane protein, putative virulence factor
MKLTIRTTLIITFFSFSGQVVGFFSQVIIAKFFGASQTLDAFLAANTLPQYIITILLGSLGSVFIPVYVDYKTKGLETEVKRLVNTLTNSIIVILGVVSFLGVLFSRQLLKLSTPGLDEESLNVGSKIAMIVWPTVMATGLISFFLAIYQAESKFNWQAIVPFIGSVVNLVGIVVLANSLKGIGLAIAATISAIVQVFLLANILKGKYHFILNWNDEGIKKIFKLFIPLFLVTLLTKFTPLLDRYLGSEFREGSISHLNYAFKVVVIVSMIISTGISVIIFPKMALNVSEQNFIKLRNTMSKGFKIMWLAIAPAISIGFFLSMPLVVTVFQRNMFTASDSLVVSNMLKIYLFSLVGMCLGTVSGKIFYVLNDTKTMAIAGIIEAIVYVFYTVYLTKWLGILGIVLGYVIYFSLSISWHLIYLKIKLKIKGGKNIILFFMKVLLAAIVGGTSTYWSTTVVTAPIIQIIVGSIIGLIAYTIILRIFVYYEIKLLFI